MTCGGGVRPARGGWTACVLKPNTPRILRFGELKQHVVGLYASPYNNQFPDLESGSPSISIGNGEAEIPSGFACQ
jgi:hypothetical protein